MFYVVLQCYLLQNYDEYIKTPGQKAYCVHVVWRCLPSKSVKPGLSTYDYTSIALSKSEHTSSLLSSARKNLTSLKISCFSVFEVDSVAMFKLARPPYWNWFGNWRLAGKRVVPSHLICTLQQNTLGLRGKRWVVNREK